MAGDPTTIAADWAAKLAASTSKIERGVDAVQVSPGQLASRQAAVWAQNTAAAQAKFARNTAAVSLPDWQNAMKQKGISRIGSGAQAAQGKFAEFLTRFLPHVDSVRRSLPPRGTLDQNIDRMVRNARGMAAFGQRSQ